MREIPDDPIIRCMERTGYPPRFFLREARGFPERFTMNQPRTPSSEPISCTDRKRVLEKKCASIRFPKAAP